MVNYSAPKTNKASFAVSTFPNKKAKYPGLLKEGLAAKIFGTDWNEAGFWALQSTGHPKMRRKLHRSSYKKKRCQHGLLRLPILVMLAETRALIGWVTV